MMNGSKKSALSILIYREFLLCRKNIIILLFAVILTMIVCLLISVSMKYGNLARADEEIRHILGNSRYMGMYIGLCYMTIFGSSLNDEMRGIWRLFRKSAPVSPWILALSKKLFMIICMMISFALSFLYMAADSAISGDPISINDISILAMITALMVYLLTVDHIGVQLTHSKDKSGLISLVLSLLLAVPLAIVMKKTGISDINDPMEKMRILSDMCVDALPYSCLIIAAALIIGFVVSALIYKRREK